MGKASLDAVHDCGEGFGLGRDEEVEVVGHDDEGVEFVEALPAMVLEGGDEGFGVGGELEEAASVVGDGDDEEGSGLGDPWRDGPEWDCRRVWRRGAPSAERPE